MENIVLQRELWENSAEISPQKPAVAMPERRKMPRRRSNLFMFAGPGETAGLGWAAGLG